MGRHMNINTTVTTATKAKFKRRTFHVPYFIAAIKFMESTPSESTEYVLYYMVRLRRSVRLAQLYLNSPAE